MEHDEGFVAGVENQELEQEDCELEDVGQTVEEEPTSKYYRITDEKFFKLVAYVVQDCHGDLVDMKIIWLMRSGEWKSGGHDVVYMARSS